MLNLEEESKQVDKIGDGQGVLGQEETSCGANIKSDGMTKIEDDNPTDNQGVIFRKRTGRSHDKRPETPPLDNTGVKYKFDDKRILISLLKSDLKSYTGKNKKEIKHQLKYLIKFYNEARNNDKKNGIVDDLVSQLIKINFTAQSLEKTNNIKLSNFIASLEKNIHIADELYKKKEKQTDSVYDTPWDQDNENKRKAITWLITDKNSSDKSESQKSPELITQPGVINDEIPRTTQAATTTDKDNSEGVVPLSQKKQRDEKRYGVVIDDDDEGVFIKGTITGEAALPPNMAAPTLELQKKLEVDATQTKTTSLTANTLSSEQLENGMADTIYEAPKKHNDPDATKSLVDETLKRYKDRSKQPSPKPNNNKGWINDFSLKLAHLPSHTTLNESFNQILIEYIRKTHPLYLKKYDLLKSAINTYGNVDKKVTKIDKSIVLKIAKQYADRLSKKNKEFAESEFFRLINKDWSNDASLKSNHLPSYTTLKESLNKIIIKCIEKSHPLYFQKYDLLKSAIKEYGNTVIKTDKLFLMKMAKKYADELGKTNTEFAESEFVRLINQALKEKPPYSVYSKEGIKPTILNKNNTAVSQNLDSLRAFIKTQANGDAVFFRAIENSSEYHELNNILKKMETAKTVSVELLDAAYAKLIAIKDKFFTHKSNIFSEKMAEAFHRLNKDWRPKLPELNKKSNNKVSLAETTPSTKNEEIYDTPLDTKQKNTQTTADNNESVYDTPWDLTKNNILQEASHIADNIFNNLKESKNFSSENLTHTYKKLMALEAKTNGQLNLKEKIALVFTELNKAWQPPLPITSPPAPLYVEGEYPNEYQSSTKKKTLSRPLIECRHSLPSRPDKPYSTRQLKRLSLQPLLPKEPAVPTAKQEMSRTKGSPILNVGTGMRLYHTYRAFSSIQQEAQAGNTKEAWISMAELGTNWVAEGVERVINHVLQHSQRLAGAGSLHLGLARGTGAVVSAGMTVGFDIYNAYVQFKRAEHLTGKERQDALVNGVVSVLSAASSVALSVAAVLSATTASAAGPIGLGVGVMITVGMQIYSAVRQVEEIEKFVSLQSSEKLLEGIRAALGLGASQAMNEAVRAEAIARELVNSTYQATKSLLEKDKSIMHAVYRTPAIQSRLIETKPIYTKELVGCGGGRLGIETKVEKTVVSYKQIYEDKLLESADYWDFSKGFEEGKAQVSSRLVRQTLAGYTLNTQTYGTRQILVQDEKATHYTDRDQCQHHFDLGGADDVFIGVSDCKNIVVFTNGSKQISGGQQNDTFILRPIFQRLVNNETMPTYLLDGKAGQRYGDTFDYLIQLFNLLDGNGQDDTLIINAEFKADSPYIGYYIDLRLKENNIGYRKKGETRTSVERDFSGQLRGGTVRNIPHLMQGTFTDRAFAQQPSAHEFHGNDQKNHFAAKSDDRVSTYGGNDTIFLTGRAWADGGAGDDVYYVILHPEDRPVIDDAEGANAVALRNITLDEISDWELEEKNLLTHLKIKTKTGATLTLPQTYIKRGESYHLERPFVLTTYDGFQLELPTEISVHNLRSFKIKAGYLKATDAQYHSAKTGMTLDLATSTVTRGPLGNQALGPRYQLIGLDTQEDDLIFFDPSAENNWASSIQGNDQIKTFGQKGSIYIGAGAGEVSIDTAASSQLTTTQPALLNEVFLPNSVSLSAHHVTFSVDGQDLLFKLELPGATPTDAKTEKTIRHLNAAATQSPTLLLKDTAGNYLLTSHNAAGKLTSFLVQKAQANADNTTHFWLPAHDPLKATQQLNHSISAFNGASDAVTGPSFTTTAIEQQKPHLAPGL